MRGNKKEEEKIRTSPRTKKKTEWKRERKCLGNMVNQFAPPVALKVEPLFLDLTLWVFAPQETHIHISSPPPLLPLPPTSPFPPSPKWVRDFGMSREVKGRRRGREKRLFFVFTKT